MGISKLNDYDARCIGDAIAKKAMEHLITPIDEEVAYFVRTCYENLLTDLGITGREKEFIDAGLLQETECTSFKFFISKDESYRETLSSVGSAKLLLGVLYACWRTDSPPVIEAYSELNGKRRPYILKRATLAAELKHQLIGKSAKYIMKVWPEAAQFVADYFNIDVAGKDISMTTPLSELLAKYMPMLSAPQPEMEGADHGSSR